MEEDGNIADLINNKYMNEFAKYREKVDRETHLDDLFHNRK